MYQVASSLRRRRYPCGYFADQPFHQLWNWLNRNTGVYTHLPPNHIDFFLQITFLLLFQQFLKIEYLSLHFQFKTNRRIRSIEFEFSRNGIFLQHVWNSLFHSFSALLFLLLKNVNETDIICMYSFSISIARLESIQENIFSSKKHFETRNGPFIYGLSRAVATTSFNPRTSVTGMSACLSRHEYRTR